MDFLEFVDFLELLVVVLEVLVPLLVFVTCLLVLILGVLTVLVFVLVVGVIFSCGGILIDDSLVCDTGADTVLFVVLPIKLFGVGIRTCKNGTVK
jgi:hypothetical protein